MKAKHPQLSSLLYSNRDANGSIEVVEKNDFRTLHFGTPVPQSQMSLHDPYALTLECTQLMAMSLLFLPSPKSVLFLGAGGGSLPKFLWKYFPKSQLYLIDRSSLTMEVTHQFFALPHSSRIHIIIADAFEFIKKTDLRFDLIFVDLFHGEGISNLVGNKDFFKFCHQILMKKDSLFVWNTWKRTPENLMIESLHHLKETFGQRLIILPDKHETNFIFIAFAEEITQISSDLLETRAQKLTKKTHLDFLDRLKSLNYLY